MLVDSLLLLLSLILLYFGAELALNSSEKLGIRAGLSPLTIGMLLVGMGTSLPELFVSHIASMAGSYDMAIGNIIGSNIANTFLILSISTLFVKLPLGDDNLKQNLFFHLILGFLIVLTFAIYQKINLTTFTYLAAFFFIYLYFIYREMKINKDYSLEKSELLEKEIIDFKDSTTALVFVMLVGFAMLYAGGELLVRAGSSLCQSFGISEYIISVIFVSFGTSVPELITSVVAAFRKKHTDIIVGNIIGSNIFNVGMILGSLGFYQIEIKQNSLYESVALLVVSLVLFIMSTMKLSLNKLSSCAFFAVYLFFLYHWIK